MPPPEHLAAEIRDTVTEFTGAHAAADFAGRLEHPHVQPGQVQPPGGRQARQPGTDHEDVAV